MTNAINISLDNHLKIWRLCIEAIRREDVEAAYSDWILGVHGRMRWSASFLSLCWFGSEALKKVSTSTRKCSSLFNYGIQERYTNSNTNPTIYILCQWGCNESKQIVTVECSGWTVERVQWCMQFLGKCHVFFHPFQAISVSAGKFRYTPTRLKQTTENIY